MLNREFPQIKNCQMVQCFHAHSPSKATDSEKERDAAGYKEDKRGCFILKKTGAVRGNGGGEIGDRDSRQSVRKVETEQLEAG